VPGSNLDQDISYPGYNGSISYIKKGHLSNTLEQFYDLGTVMQQMTDTVTDSNNSIFDLVLKGSSPQK
jgi:hypothetical protein